MRDQAIICVGNRLVAEDVLGGRVYDALATLPALQEHADLVDGGLMGLDLLGRIESHRKVIFVDALDESNFAKGVYVLSRDQVASFADVYGHEAGLPYLFNLMPKVCPAPLPEVVLVGGAGPATEALVQMVVDRCLEIAGHGRN